MRTLIGYVLQYADNLWEGTREVEGYVTARKEERFIFPSKADAMEVRREIIDRTGARPKLVTLYRKKKSAHKSHTPEVNNFEDGRLVRFKRLQVGDYLYDPATPFGHFLEMGQVLWLHEEGVVVKWEETDTKPASTHYYSAAEAEQSLYRGYWSVTKKPQE